MCNNYRLLGKFEFWNKGNFTTRNERKSLDSPGENHLGKGGGSCQQCSEILSQQCFIVNYSYY